VTGKKLHEKDFHNLQHLPNIIRKIKTKRQVKNACSPPPWTV
jgi:hypothetical protein